jgi:V8-like Glu-specific endopeptidase
MKTSYFTATALLTTATLALSGCAALEQHQREMEARKQAWIDQRTAVLVEGTSQSAFRAVWGSPDDTTTTVVGETVLKTLQYGTCSHSLVGSSEIFYITFINDKLARWSSGRC